MNICSTCSTCSRTSVREPVCKHVQAENMFGGSHCWQSCKKLGWRSHFHHLSAEIDDCRTGETASGSGARVFSCRVVKSCNCRTAEEITSLSLQFPALELQIVVPSNQKYLSARRLCSAGCNLLWGELPKWAFQNAL